ncbi:unnamed protein product, partial [Ilex paraguariensis]
MSLSPLSLLHHLSPSATPTPLSLSLSNNPIAPFSHHPFVTIGNPPPNSPPRYISISSSPFLPFPLLSAQTPSSQALLTATNDDIKATPLPTHKDDPTMIIESLAVSYSYGLS